MWRNYLTVGIRALLKSKTYAFINIFGLALALAPCLILLLYVRYETTYDSWIPNADRAFQLQTFVSEMPLGGPGMGQRSSFAARTALVKDFPQIENAVHVMDWSPSVIQHGEASIAKPFALVDGNLFDIIQMPFLEGNPEHALDRPGELVLTQTEANRRFPHQDAMGRTLTLVLEDKPADYRVAGILRDPPKNTHLRLGIIARYDPHALHSLATGVFTDWSATYGRIYFRLRSGTDAAAINEQLPAWLKRKIGREPSFPVGPGKSVNWGLSLVNIRNIHLGGVYFGTDYGFERRTVITFGLVALLILGTAVANFVNLATARGSQRAREVALRKVAGASRLQLIVQFLAESVLLTGFAMLLGLAIAELLLPHVNAFLDVDMTIRYFGRDGVSMPILALILIVGIVGGAYPALYLSRLQPARILKANKSAAETEGSGRLRSLLVVCQFAVSIGLIICTAVIYAQNLYARTSDQGFKRENLLQVGNIDPSIPQSRRERLQRDVEKIAGVRQAALTSIGVNADGVGHTYELRLAGKSDPVTLNIFSVGANFFDTMGMPLLAGRKHDEKLAIKNMIVTELAARAFGFATPEAAVGKPVRLANGGGVLTITAVVKDARFVSARNPLTPAIYEFSQGDFNTLMVRYDAQDPRRISAEIAKLWRQEIPTLPVRIDYVDDRLRELYAPDEARGRLFGAFAIVAMVIGCLGLFGLAAFTAERRTKEIGIRKVLGATTGDIVRLLAWQFSRPVLIANLIAWPVAWWLMRDWLNGFDARIKLSPAYFLAAGVLALLIALGTIAGHAFKVARAKPIRALRYE